MSIKQLCLKSCRNNKPPWDSDVGWWRLSKEYYCFSSISVSLSPAKSSQALWMFSHECINCARPSTSLLLSLFFLPHYCKMRFLLLCYVWRIPFTYYFNLHYRLKIFFFFYCLRVFSKSWYLLLCTSLQLNVKHFWLIVLIFCSWLLWRISLR